MAEWFKAHAWKVCVLLKVPRVRIPVSPPKIKNYLKKGLIHPLFFLINLINFPLFFNKNVIIK